jgi:SAM-dependent methyltransferase
VAIHDADLSTETVRYGHDVPDERELRLCGDVSGKRVLDVGCGTGPASVAFARSGARVVGVDPSAEALAEARLRCDQAEVRIELHHGDLAALAFLGPASVDLAFSAGALGHVSDLTRVFRQVHRVLKPSAPFVFSLPHPTVHLIDPRAEHSLVVRRSYWDRSAVRGSDDGDVPTYQHTMGDLVMGLVRSNFRVDALVEPEPTTTGTRSPSWVRAYGLVPSVVIVKARKEGI